MYDPKTLTASASFRSPITFGPDRQYMTVRVAMHELSHAAGLGTMRAWFRVELNPAAPRYEVSGPWLGQYANAELQQIVSEIGVPRWFLDRHNVYNGTILIGDMPHYSPFGLQQAYELEELGQTPHQVFVAACRLVMAFVRDMAPYADSSGQRSDSGREPIHHPPRHALNQI